MASSSLSSTILGVVYVDFSINNEQYKQVKLNIMNDLCLDMLLGLDFQKKHESLTLKLGGDKPPLIICGLSTLNVSPPSLFSNLMPNCKPVASKSRRYNKDDRQFIENEIQRMLKEDIIEPSNSPWRAQVVVTRGERSKKRLVIDYSQTINKFTQLDAYPLPRIDDQVNSIAQYKVFSTIDLKSAYHQVPISNSEKKYTAFEANGGLYQFKRMPFGITNGVSCFQRTMNEFIEDEELSDTFAYLDNITICGRTQKEHDDNLEKFLQSARKMNLTYNEDKCIFSVNKLCILGYVIENGTIKPDPNRLQPMRDMPPPHDAKSMKRIIGLFSYYSKWIPKFSDKIASLTKNTKYPLDKQCLLDFNQLKMDIENSVIDSIDESAPFEIETDASDIALAAVLNQNGRPVAFFSRTLQTSELKHPSIEKEACAIIEAVRYWKHYLTGHHFKLITDQQPVSYIFEKQHKSKIKNDKIYRWKIELSCYSYDIVYREGKLNIPADTFSRVYCSMINTDTLTQLHQSLCHPGVTRMYAFVKNRNLPFSVDDVRQMIKLCKICCECKPRYHKPVKSHLIKATQPFERLNLDFKGPLPSDSRNKYFLTIVDEYSRFPFAIPCPDVSTQTVINCLSQIFSIFGLPSYVHSDRGSSFISKELKQYLREKGVAASQTTAYNPQCNGQTERYNGIIMKSIELATRQHKLPIKLWEKVLPDVLHSIRSLICTATMETPHERMFSHQRRTTTGCAVPTWLNQPGPVLLKRHVRNNKYEPVVDEVQLLEANPQYAHIRYPNGRETTVSIRHLAPTGLAPIDSMQPTSGEPPLSSLDEPPSTSPDKSYSDTPLTDPTIAEVPEIPVRRSLRVSRQPVRLIEEV